MLKEFIEDESGVAVLEIVLVLVVIVACVLIFKKELTALVNSIFEKVKSNAGEV
jgi:Flp pilus assembly pilin Flp